MKEKAIGTPPENTLRIRSIKHLAWALDVLPEALVLLAENVSNYYRSFERDVKGKKRLLVEATGDLKKVQRAILDNILMRLSPFPSSFGAVRGRTIKDNAYVHVRSRFIAKLDVRSFYPSVHRKRVYGFWVSQECSPDVAHVLTALTTKDHALPLGTSTSPALADQIVRSVDYRINDLAVKSGLNYTRYVDDITLSGPFPLERFTRTAAEVLRQNGFKIKKSKLVFYGPDDESDDRVITGVGIRDGRISAPLSYMLPLTNELWRAIRQSRQAIVDDDFLPREHYRGKIAYINWLDPDYGRRLLRLYRKVKWRHLEWAMRQRLCS